MADYGAGIPYVMTPGAALYREKLLLRGRDHLPRHLEELPGFDFTAPFAGEKPEESIKTFTKGMIQLIAASIVANAPSENWSFASLVQLEVNAGKLSFSFLCPFPKLVADLKEQVARVKLRLTTMRGLGDLGIEYRFGLPDAIRVPLIFVYSHERRHLLVTNRNQYSSPQQFLNLDLTRSTSGFLNFIGVLIWSHNEGGAVDLTRLPALAEAAVTAKHDEWLRWFYGFVDKQEVLMQSRILIDPENPETYYYNYYHG